MVGMHTGLFCFSVSAWLNVTFCCKEKKQIRCCFLSAWCCRCSCDSVLATSEACVPLVACPEAAPLIGALLRRPVSCVRATLSEDFLGALSSAYSRYSWAWCYRVLLLKPSPLSRLWIHVLTFLFQSALVIGRGGSGLFVVSQSVQSGGSSTQSAGLCSHQLRVNTTEARGAICTISSGG